MILLRFGSLTDASKAWKTPAEVCRITGVKRQTQNFIIKRWLQRGQRVVSHAKNAGRKKVLSEEQQRYLVNPKTLQAMRHLSLVQRAEELRQQWRLPTLGKETLRRYYLRLGVHFKKPPHFYDTKTMQAAFILKHQQEFSRNLTSILMAQQREVIYVDETTFNLWMTPSKVWFKDGMTLHIAKHRGQSITLIGALSNQRGLLHYSCF